MIEPDGKIRYMGRCECHDCTQARLQMFRGNTYLGQAVVGVAGAEYTDEARQKQQAKQAYDMQESMKKSMQAYPQPRQGESR